MITLNPASGQVSRVVILGAKGFVASTVNQFLLHAGIATLPLARTDLDLTSETSGARLGEMLQPTDTLLFVSAKAPVKNEQMLLENLSMAAAVCEAVKIQNPAHLVYISSDAVYADSATPLTENSCAEPASLHGVMHLAREVMLKNAFSGPICILRPTLIFGQGDPHNGYGPNRFIRLAAAGKKIELFGNGEERRDHVWVKDVAEVTLRVIMGKATGVLNIATGEVVAFSAIAEKAVTVANSKTEIVNLPRSGSVPHNGYRPFDIIAAKNAFPDFQYRSLFSVIESEANGSW